jgi:hypothetical protein
MPLSRSESKGGRLLFGIQPTWRSHERSSGTGTPK